ncbi:uncharacterized protein GGS22DRAFT_41983 [Annulohypoxylon maeteangense]|uniref:uncharacterized protein n=1 Tax=Annulohypoxylon maeteangense TaxID=1927788 RepID=UPI0020077A60|nr:uncharacterized protein GGS22DRAFT_41983 [Annulohypoxylon maeteangense]KAI0882882.1 hypothetical protein GGS22DRAFT_41983 [Annulohypoxylon maeteangense]
MPTTSSPHQILFYDIAPGPPIRPFAPNPWKARYALNFKRANFITKWVALPDITATRKSLGADPVRFLASGEPFYTLPVIKDTSTDEVVGDSFDIAVYLEKKYPDEPALFRSSIGVYAAFNAHIDSIFPKGGILFSEGFPFDPANEEQVKAEFCRRAGLTSWDQLTVSGEERRKVVESYEVSLAEAAKYFRYSEGPFIGGKEPDYADFIVGGWLMMLSQVVAEWKEIRTWHGGVWGRLHDALEPYRGTW